MIHSQYHCNKFERYILNLKNHALRTIRTLSQFFTNIISWSACYCFYVSSKKI